MTPHSLKLRYLVLVVSLAGFTVQAVAGEYLHSALSWPPAVVSVDQNTRRGTGTSNFLVDRLERVEQFDSDLGFYYLRARYMNPRTGRFMSMDDEEGVNGQSLSLHIYVREYPIHDFDSSLTDGFLNKTSSATFRTAQNLLFALHTQGPSVPKPFVFVSETPDISSLGAQRLTRSI